MDTIIIAVDLGHFRAYRIIEKTGGSPSIELIESRDSAEGLGKMGEMVSDQAGRFRRDSGKDIGATGYGEAHNLALEMENRAVRQIVKAINDLIQKEQYPGWCLAAGKKINRKIIDSLRPDIKAGLVKNITADLTKTHKSEILAHFD